MKRILFSLIAAGLMTAQEKTPAENAVDTVRALEATLSDTRPMVSAVIPVQHLTGDAFQRLVRLLYAFKSASISADEKLRTIVVFAPKDVVDQVKKVVVELDRPGSEASLGRNVDVTLSFLWCTNKTSADEPTPLPADLEGVAKQLRTTTQYKRIELWEVLPLRLQEGKQTEQTSRLSGRVLGLQSAGVYPTAVLRLNPESISQREGGRWLRFERFNVNFSIPYAVIPNNWNHMSVGLAAPGDFKEGQKTVIGKVGIDDDSAVFVVVALKILD